VLYTRIVRVINLLGSRTKLSHYVNDSKMEGLNYLCLGLFLCPISLLIGVGVFFLVRYGSRLAINKWLGSKRVWISIPIAVILSAIAAYAFFHFQFAPAFPGYYHPSRQPRNEDIVGTWIATNGTREYLGELGYTHSEPTLILNSSGKFTATDFPDILFFHRNLILHSGEGTWAVVRDFQGYWQVELTFDRIDPSWYPDPPLSGPTPCAGLSVPCGGLEFNFDLWNRKAPYYIFEYIGGELGPNIYYQRIGDNHEDS
jgi:hypothetical protein